jgi:2'-5' RNA ligase
MHPPPGEEQTALIVPVPEAEPVVGRFRAELDTSAAKGIPAHVTVLYPFLRPTALTTDVLNALRDLFAGYEPFGVDFTEVRWFGDVVTWLAPEPDMTFRRLTAEVWHSFPEAPPYGGEHDGNHPHLTIGHDRPVDVLEQAAHAVTAQLPVAASIDAVHLVAGSDAPNSWRTLEVFTLGNPD